MSAAGQRMIGDGIADAEFSEQPAMDPAEKSRLDFAGARRALLKACEAWASKPAWLEEEEAGRLHEARDAACMAYVRAKNKRVPRKRKTGRK